MLSHLHRWAILATACPLGRRGGCTRGGAGGCAHGAVRWQQRGCGAGAGGVRCSNRQGEQLCGLTAQMCNASPPTQCIPHPTHARENCAQRAFVSAHDAVVLSFSIGLAVLALCNSFITSSLSPPCPAARALRHRPPFDWCKPINQISGHSDSWQMLGIEVVAARPQHCGTCLPPRAGHSTHRLQESQA